MEKDNKLENKVEDEQLEEVSGGAHGGRIRKDLCKTEGAKPVFTVGKNAKEVSDELDANGQKHWRP